MRTSSLKIPLISFLALLFGAMSDRAQNATHPSAHPALTNSIGMKLALIPPGEFMMGSTPEEGELMLPRMKAKGVHEWYQQSPPSESPRHRVKITKPFHIGIYEVTLGDFKKFVQASGYRTDAEKDGKGADGKLNGKWTTKPEFNWKEMGYERSDAVPVVNVTWNDAVAFCAWLSKKEARQYRLPTEAEWEYACRAGTATLFYWGSDESLRNQYVWHGGNSGGGPHPVGELKPNAFGLFDMNGNAYEYCLDWHTTNSYLTTIIDDPKGPASGVERVVRSGSWGTDPMHCRSAFRGGSGGQDHRNRRDGFRVVLVAP